VTALIRGGLPGCRRRGDGRGRKAAADLAEVSRGRSTGGDAMPGRAERQASGPRVELVVVAAIAANPRTRAWRECSR
jgi:hypothetical protein